MIGLWSFSEMAYFYFFLHTDVFKVQVVVEKLVLLKVWIL